MGKMRFVIIGCGRISTLHVVGYKNNPDAELWGVCDIKRANAETFAKAFAVPKVYDCFEAVLADETVVGVELIIPHHLHCEYTVRLCEAKKHVSVQKPMAMNLEECDKMIQAAKDNGVKLKIYENFVHYPPYQWAKKMLEEGEIGSPQGIRLKMTNAPLLSKNMPAAFQKKLPDQVPKDLPPTGWEIDPKSWLWRFNVTLSGGGPTVFDDGYHKFSIATYFMGAIEKVSAWIDQTPVAPGVYNDVPGTIMWKYKDKKLYGIWDIVNAEEMYINSKYYTCDERVEITGSRGIIWVTRCTATLMEDVAPVVMYRDGKRHEFWDMKHDWADSFEACTKDFIEAIKNDREPLLSGEAGKEVLKFALAAIDSSKQKKEIYLSQYEDKEIPKKRSLIASLLFGEK
ncbi:MAG: Gfo/Idh/MocA family oxidoreductase [Lachnospiraceae bacterium]|nr:Gfo/Idh/MocA family oxidoreductase [Lachnospiraceae bacterium]